jgi:glycosyltransferase involved in cell wall biosynthesis
MHIAMAGPMAGAELAPLLGCARERLPRGYAGAPLVAQIVQGLLARGHRVTALSLSAELPPRADAVAAFEHGALRVVFCPMRRRAWRFNGAQPGRIVDLFRLERRALAQQLRQAAPDLVHGHWAYEFGWAAATSGRPHLVTCHDAPQRIAEMQTSWQHRAYRQLCAVLARRTLALAERVSAVSPYLIEQVQPLCRVPVQLVPNALSQEAMVRRRAAQAGRERLLVVANGFGARKNTQAALRAAARVAASRPRVELVMLGHDHGPQGLAERWWRAQGPSALAVQFIGPCSHDEVLGWMSRSDVLLHPALEESFGLVLAEAMAVGLPVVAGQGVAAVPWVTGGAARLVDVQDPAAIADAAASLLADPRSAEALAEQARTEALARFTPDRLLDGYEALYRGLLRMGPTAC